MVHKRLVTALAATFLLSLLFQPFARSQSNDINSVSLESLLDEQVSTASKYFQPQSNAPSSITVITSVDIEQSGAASLQEILQFVRSFYISYDRNYHYLGVRGFSRPADYNDRILLLLNGHTLNDIAYGQATFGTEFPINPSLIDHIEVVRGAGSSVYGSYAMFAVINIITKTPGTFEGTKLSAEIGTDKSSAVRFLFGKHLSDASGFMLSGTGSMVKGNDLYYKEYADINNGIASGKDRDHNGNLFFNYFNGDFSAQAMYSSRYKQVPTASYSGIINDPDEYTIDSKGLLECTYSKKLSVHHSISSRIYCDYYHFNGNYPFIGDNGKTIEEDNNTAQWAGFEITANWSPAENLNFIYGGAWQSAFDNDFSTRVDSRYIVNAEYLQNTASAYLQTDYQLFSELAFSAGARVDKIKNLAASLSPRGAIIWKPYTETTIKFIYGTAYRIPNIYELYYFDRMTTKQSTGLKTEKINSTELTIEHRLAKNLFFSITTFNNLLSDLIDTRTDPADTLSYFQNISHATSRGIEFEIQSSCIDKIRASINYSLQTAFGDNNEKLPNSPRGIANFRVSYTFLPKTFAALSMHYESPRIYEASHVTAESSSTSAFLLTNFLLQTSIAHPDLTFRLKVNNLFNVDYSYPVNFEFLQKEIQQDRRTFIFTTRYQF